MSRPLLVDVLDGRSFVRRINDYSTPEAAAQALAEDFARVRAQGEELKTEALLDTYDRGWNAAIYTASRDLREWARYIGSRPEGEAVAGHLEETIAAIGRLMRCAPPLPKECGSCGGLGRLRGDGTVRCDECWGKDQRAVPSNGTPEEAKR